MTSEHSPWVIRELSQIGGRALLIDARGWCFVAHGYRILRSDDGGRRWTLDCSIPATGWRPWVASVRLGARLLRHYIASLEILSDGTRVAVAHDGIYRALPGEPVMQRVFHFQRGSRPLSLAVDSRDRILFGEYGSLERSEVCVYASEDRGGSFEPVFTFRAGDIRHVHSIVVEPSGGFWVTVGDFGEQPGVGLLSDDLRYLDWLARGHQRVRAVRVLVRPECLIYGTDSDRERNFIVRLDKRTAEVTILHEIEGSSLFAADFGSCSAVTTCVEPNLVCRSRDASLYLSSDGENWDRYASFTKDRYHPILFQFGTLVLPSSHYEGSIAMFSGQAVDELDGTTRIVEFSWNCSG
jgi:hypothetical protein